MLSTGLAVKDKKQCTLSESSLASDVCQKPFQTLQTVVYHRACQFAKDPPHEIHNTYVYYYHQCKVFEVNAEFVKMWSSCFSEN